MAPQKIDVTASTTEAETKAMAARAVDPVLQVGSRTSKVDQGPRAWRSLLAGRDFTGLDIESGENVDVVADLCAPFAEVETALGGRRFGFVICQHVLEHVADPFAAARTLADLTAPGGLVYVATPWVQAFHGYPNDFWRFSFPGLVRLFPDLEPVDMYWSAAGGGHDAAYKLLVDGAIDLARTPFEVEASLFELAFESDENRTLLARQPQQPKLPLARRYLPAIFTNVLFEKRTSTPADHDRPRS